MSTPVPIPLWPLPALLGLALPVLAEAPQVPVDAPVVAPAAAVQPLATQAPAGAYQSDPAHTRLMVGVDNMGFSETWLFFRAVEADLIFDPQNPEAMTVAAWVDPASVETLDARFNGVIAGPRFLDAARFPEMSFSSTSVRLTAPDSAAVTGELTLHGVTRPITLRVRFNQGSPGQAEDLGGARVGFSAGGTIFRSDFGIGPELAAPGQAQIGDLVTLRIEAEFVNPDAPGPQLGP